MERLHHTGASASIDFYSEPHGGRVWCEVLRWRSALTRRPLPVFYIRVYRQGYGIVAEHTYRPRKAVAPGPLPDDVVTRLVRQALATGPEN